MDRIDTTVNSLHAIMEKAEVRVAASRELRAERTAGALDDQRRQGERRSGAGGLRAGITDKSGPARQRLAN
jgi:hypothetical protein